MRTIRTTETVKCDGCGKKLKIDDVFDIQLRRYGVIDFVGERVGTVFDMSMGIDSPHHTRAPDFCKPCYKKAIKQYITLIERDLK